MILAAGEGRRMQPLTRSRAKPSLPVLGIPLVVQAARLLHSAGIREIVVNLHHHGRTVREALENRQRDPRHLALSEITFSYSHEESLLGTAGGIGRVREWLAAEGTAIVVNSDFLSDIDLKAALDRHRAAHALATLVVANPCGPFPGELWIDASGSVVSIGVSPGKAAGASLGRTSGRARVARGGEKATSSASGANRGDRSPGGRGPEDPEAFRASAEASEAVGPLEFTGVQVLEPEMLTRFPDSRGDSIRDVYIPALTGGRIHAARHAGRWWEFGSLDRFLEGVLSLARQRREVEEGSVLETPDGGLAWLGPGAILSAGAKVRGVAVIEGGARVSSGAALEDSIVLEFAQVPSWCRLKRCIVAREAVLTGGMAFENRAIASSPCSAPSTLASAPETPGGRPAPPEGCDVLTDLWVRKITE